MIRQNVTREIVPDEVTPAKTVEQVAAELGFAEHLPEICQITQELFPGESDVEVGEFPESPQDQYLVFIVQVIKGSDVSEHIRRQCEWHDRVSPFFPNRPDALRILTVYR